MTVPEVQLVDSGHEMPAEIGARDFTVIYDGSCNVCTRMAGVLREWDGEHKLQVVSSQTPGVKERFHWIPEANYADSLQVVAADGRTFQGARAIEELLAVLPKGSLIVWVFAIPFVRPLSERFYRWFARNRYKLGCGDHCAYRPKK